MRIIRGLPHALQKIDCAVAIGNFDGVHIGHQALLEATVNAARARGLMPAVVTFEPHPKEFFGTSSHTRICTLRDKVERILACGIERVYIMPFTARFAALSAQEFARDILAEGLHCRWVSVGDNFHFGAGGKGSYAVLEELGHHYGFEANATPLLLHKNERVSSSRIRAAMQLGDMYDVSRMLGRPYCVTGRVIHGAALGRTLGYPTLNTALFPAGCKAGCALHGVFAVRVFCLNKDIVYGGVASVGFKPTVSVEKRWLLETHVFDFSGDAYGRMIRVEFLEKLRDEKKFSGLDELRSAIATDAERAKAILGISARAPLFCL